MELTKEQMKRVIEEPESSYETKMLEDKFLEEIINLFKKYLNSGETKSYIDVRSSNTWEMMVFILFIIN